jgi:hypothetical protein
MLMHGFPYDIHFYVDVAPQLAGMPRHRPLFARLPIAAQFSLSRATEAQFGQSRAMQPSSQDGSCVPQNRPSCFQMGASQAAASAMALAERRAFIHPAFGSRKRRKSCRQVEQIQSDPHFAASFERIPIPGERHTRIDGYVRKVLRKIAAARHASEPAPSAALPYRSGAAGWRPSVKMSLCNFDHNTKIAAAASQKMRSTIFIDQASDAPICKVWMQPMVTNVSQIGRHDEALAN